MKWGASSGLGRARLWPGFRRARIISPSPSAHIVVCGWYSLGGVDRAGVVSDLRKSTLFAPMTPLVAGWASSPARPILLRPFRSNRLAYRGRRMVPVSPTLSLVALAEGEVRPSAVLLVSMLDGRIHLALFHSLVQRTEHSLGTQALGYCPAHESSTEHIEDAQVHEFRQGRHVQPAPRWEAGVMSSIHSRYGA